MSSASKTAVLPSDEVVECQERRLPCTSSVPCAAGISVQRGDPQTGEARASSLCYFSEQKEKPSQDGMNICSAGRHEDVSKTASRRVSKNREDPPIFFNNIEQYRIGVGHGS